MGIKKGLASIKSYNDEQERRKAEASAPKADWFQLKKDKESVKIRFAQELDADSPNYSAKNDVGFIAIEHSSPEDYKRKALCTLDDEGQCVACEEHTKMNLAERGKDSKREGAYKGGWKAKSRLYINVIVDNGTDEPSVAVLSQGTGGKSITPMLLDFAGENGSITDKVWKITRNGVGFNDTSYTMIPIGDARADQDLESFELFNLDKVVRHVPYDEQAAHYGLVATRSDSGGNESKSTATSADIW